MKFIGNDPTGTYRGTFQCPKRQKHQPNPQRKLLRSKTKARAKLIFNLRQAEEKEPVSKPVGKLVHPAYIPQAPNRAAYAMASISSNFWAQVKPKVCQSPLC